MRLLMVNLTNLAKIDGGGTHQLALLRNMRALGHEAHMIAPRRHPKGKPSATPENVVFSPSLTGLGFPAVFDAFLQLHLIIYYRLRHRTDYLYVRANFFTFIQVLLARILGMRVMVEHNSWLSSERSMRSNAKPVITAERVFQSWAARLAHRSRCVTSGIARKLEDVGAPPTKLFVLGNGTDTDHFHPIPRAEALSRLDLPASPTWLGFIGILTPWQGVEIAIRALALLPRDMDVRMVVAGDGPCGEALRELAGELDLKDRIVFLGHVPWQKANDVINCFDIALAPFTEQRNSEIGLSALKIRDYAAAGKYVISSDIEGIREFAGNRWLDLHRPDDPNGLADKIQSAIADGSASETAREHARSYAETAFSWYSISETLASKLKSL